MKQRENIAQDIEKQKTALKNLSKSTLFNVSLGSKELFHSNFIAWLVEKFPLEMGEIFSDYISGDKPAILELKPVKREKDNIDLTFTYTDEKTTLIIENKVKSLPYIEQLIRYSENHTSNRSYLLLSLSKPSFVKQNNEFLVKDKIKWRYMSYKDLSDSLRKIKTDNPYDDFVIKDYISFTQSLSELESVLKIDWINDYFDFSTGKIGDLDFRFLRIHDFLLKHKYDQIKHKLIEEFGKIVENGKEIKLLGNWADGSPGDCYFENGFTNSQGIVGFKFLIKKNNNFSLVLGLQLQGNALRLFVECQEKDYALKVAKILKEEEIWFNFNAVEQLKELKIQGKGQKENDKEFASFSGQFYYKYVSLGNIKMSELIEIIKYFYRYISDNCSEINERLDKVILSLK